MSGATTTFGRDKKEQHSSNVGDSSDAMDKVKRADTADKLPNPPACFRNNGAEKIKRNWRGPAASDLTTPDLEDVLREVEKTVHTPMTNS